MCRLVESPHIDLERINQMLNVALDYDFCDVSLALDDENTKFGLHFKQVRTSVFVEQWVKFWMRPFSVDYNLNFDEPENGKKLAVSCGVEL